MFRRLIFGVAAAAAIIAGSITSAPIAARAGDPIPDIDVVDPPGQYLYSDAVVEHTQVLSRDGVTKIWVDIIRPNTPAGTQVPTIMDASPYFNTLGRGYKSELKNPADPSINWASTDPFYASGPRVPFPEWLDEFFVPRGYAIALVDLRGSRNSQGCEVYGAGDEGRDAMDVVDWIATQSWSNGKAGMIGGSYDGTNANSAAADAGARNDTHLAAIVPIRAIDRWYDYHFFGGAQSNDHLLTPDSFTAVYPLEDTPNYSPSDPSYAATFDERKACIASLGAATSAQYDPPYQNADSAFWTDRNFLKNAATWKAATFFIHGLFDFNVKTSNTGQLWAALPAGVPHKVWWMNADHADPDIPTAAAGQASGHLMPFPFQQKFETEVHRWFAQYLKNLAAGADLTPRVEAQRYDGHWDPYSTYPTQPADRIVHFTPTNTATDAPAAAGSLAWRDSPSSSAPASQVFNTDPYPEDTRISGQFEFDLSIAAQGEDTTIGVQITDVPPTGTVVDNLYDQNVTGPFDITFAYLRAWYRGTVNPRGASTPTIGAPLVPNQQTLVSFPSFYTDFIVRAGHHLRFTIANNAGGHIVTTDQGNTITMLTGAAGGVSQVRIPTAPIVEPAPPPAVPEFPGGAIVVPAVVAAVLALFVALRRRPVVPR